MNIKDVIKKNKEEGIDMLESIFNRQKELEAKYHGIEVKNGAHCPSIPLDLDTFAGQERVRLLFYRITEEIYEAGNAMRNKAWKQSQVPTDKDHFLEELSDAFHFFIELMLELGLEAEDLYSLYFRKSEVNKFRIRSDY